MTNIPIRDYVDERLHDLQELMRTRFEARADMARREIAVIDERLAKMNEIREQLNKQYTGFTAQISLYLPREEYSARHDALTSLVRRVEDTFNLYTRNEVTAVIQNELRSMAEWKSNIIGRFWALAVLLALFEVFITIGIKVLLAS